MKTFFLKASDTGPSLLATLLDPVGDAVDLSTFSGLVWLHVRVSDTITFSRHMEVLDNGTAALRGRVRYAWQAADWGTGADLLPTTSGTYPMEYECVPTVGARQTFSNNPRMEHELRVYRDIGQGTSS